MDPSPNGHEIEVVFGDAGRIRSRGVEVENLGDQMIGAAGVLRAIADNGVPQHGLSIDKIKEVVGEIDAELKLAGERYKPSGTALVAYADVLASVQTEMERIVPRARTAWEEYERRRSAHASVEHAPLVSPTGGEGADDALADRDDDLRRAAAAMGDARDDFDAEGRLFDEQYETWEVAFERAANDIRDATEGGIQDGFWDDVDGFVDGMLVVLQWAGIVLAVLALVIGGPIIALLGAIVAVATLALTIYQKARGDTGWTELAIAIVGVIPFGSFAKFGGANGGLRAGTLGVLDGFTGGLATSASRSTLRVSFDFGTNWADAGAAGLNGFSRVARTVGGSSALDDVAARLMGMANAQESMYATNAGGAGVLGLTTGHWGWVANAPGQLAMAGIDGLQDGRDARTVDTWEAQLAR